MQNTGRRRFTAIVIAVAGLTGSPVQAQVVISQVYGGGGNSGATLRSDFIELRNNGANPVSVDGWSVQYASASGSSWQRTVLAGSIAPGGYYLVKQGDGAGGTLDLPTPDAIGTTAMAGSSGKVALSSSDTTLAGACPLDVAGLQDFVGYGSAGCAETAPAPGLSNTTAALRNGAGSIDTDSNAADFSRGDPDPRNGASQAPPPPPPAWAATIAQIQGAGLASPLDEAVVVTEGIVTALKFNNGFFLQSANDDGDPATSDGIFVFTGSAPPATVAVGNRVRVTATVEEFVPGSNPNQLGITELVSPTIELLATGQPLPAAIELDATLLGADATPATLEPLEGMRVSVASAVSVSPSGGSINERAATSSSDGVFHVVLPGVARPFREPGIGVLDASLAALPAGKNPPLFDTNPERLMVRSRGQVGALPLAVDTGAQIDGLLGVLDYFAGTWALLPDAATPPVASGGLMPQAVADASAIDVTVASFNLLRFFDEVADGNGAPTLEPQALDTRLGKTAAAVCDFLKAPDILGVVEVENLRVLDLLAQRVNSGCARAPAYVAYLEQGNDVGGINVGFLVSARLVDGGLPRVEVIDVSQVGKDATVANPNGSTSVLNDRPPLLLQARVHQDAGASYPLTVIVNHLRSLNGVDDVRSGSNGWATGGERVRVKRGAQAVYLAALVESLQQADPAQPIVLVGDFNAFEFNDGYVDVLGVVQGLEAPADEVLTYFASPLRMPLIDGSQLIADAAGRYSYVFAGNAQTLDHVLFNEALFAGAAELRVDHARINADFGVDSFGDPTVPVAVSDHDPVRLSIRVAGFSAADLGARLSLENAQVAAGDVVRYSATVANAGPQAAGFPAVAFVFNAHVAPQVTAAAGWTCDAPALEGNRTTVACSAPALESGAQAVFAIQTPAPVADEASILELSMGTRSQVRDPANGNDSATAEVAVAAAVRSADLSVQAQGHADKLRGGAVATVQVDVSNAGADTARATTVVLRGVTGAELDSVSAPAGWTCSQGVAAHDGFMAQCATERMEPGSARLAFSLAIPARPRGNRPLEFTATAAADTPDPHGDDNQAVFSVPLKNGGRGH
ncbi:MAG: lamin tail domain-containing protein [Pseudomonadota bacterium]|nr:lamin tail domain-containing protein [Pseudomonadota bacterium]